MFTQSKVNSIWEWEGVGIMQCEWEYLIKSKWEWDGNGNKALIWCSIV